MRQCGHPPCSGSSHHSTGNCGEETGEMMEIVNSGKGRDICRTTDCYGVSPNPLFCTIPGLSPMLRQHPRIPLAKYHRPFLLYRFPHKGQRNAQIHHRINPSTVGYREEHGGVKKFKVRFISASINPCRTNFYFGVQVDGRVIGSA